MWTSPKYALYVSEIMDAINERTQATGESFDSIKDSIIEEQRKIIEELKQTVTVQKEYISNTSVPETNCVKKLSIVKISDEQFRLSADTSRSLEYIYQFEFPATMNIRQVITQKLNMKLPYSFEGSEIEQVLTVIRSLSPKREITAS